MAGTLCPTRSGHTEVNKHDQLRFTDFGVEFSLIQAQVLKSQALHTIPGVVNLV